MKSLSTSELAPLHFNVKEQSASKPFRASSNRIAWIRGMTDKPNSRFNITIRDGLGRIKFEKVGCVSSINKEYGELVNLPTSLGEELQVTVDGVENSENVQLFLN